MKSAYLKTFAYIIPKLVGAILALTAIDTATASSLDNLDLNEYCFGDDRVCAQIFCNSNPTACQNYHDCLASCGATYPNRRGDLYLNCLNSCVTDLTHDIFYGAESGMSLKPEQTETTSMALQSPPQHDGLSIQEIWEIIRHVLEELKRRREISTPSTNPEIIPFNSGEENDSVPSNALIIRALRRVADEVASIFRRRADDLANASTGRLRLAVTTLRLADFDRIINFAIRRMDDISPSCALEVAANFATLLAPRYGDVYDFLSDIVESFCQCLASYNHQGFLQHCGDGGVGFLPPEVVQ